MKEIPQPQEQCSTMQGFLVLAFVCQLLQSFGRLRVYTHVSELLNRGKFLFSLHFHQKCCLLQLNLDPILFLQLYKKLLRKI